MNIQLVAGSYGKKCSNNRCGITFLEFKLTNSKLINFWVTEHYQVGLELQMEESFIFQHIPIQA